MSRSPRRPARARKRSRRSSHRSPKRGSWPSRRRKRFRGVKRTIMENNNTRVMSFEEPLEYSLGEERSKCGTGKSGRYIELIFSQKKTVAYKSTARQTDFGARRACVGCEFCSMTRLRISRRLSTASQWTSKVEHM